MIRDDVTLGELLRRLDDVDERHSALLSDISREVKLTNGRTTRLEARVEGHDRELRDLKRGGLDESSAITPELRELIDLARDARGVVRFGRWIWMAGGALIPLAIWVLSQVGL